MGTKKNTVDSFGLWLQDVILDKLVVNTPNACTSFQTCNTPEINVIEAIDTNTEQPCDGILEQFLPVSPTKEQLSVLIDPMTPSHKQLAAVLQVSDVQTRPRSSTPCKYSLKFIHSIESDSKTEQLALEEPRRRFFYTATKLNTKLEDLNEDASNMLFEMVLLKHGLQELEDTTNALIQEARELREDIQDLRYLDDLIYLLSGQLDRITLRRWPFTTAHSTSQTDMNLVI